MSTFSAPSAPFLNVNQPVRRPFSQSVVYLNQAVSQSTGVVSVPGRLTQSSLAVTALNHRNVFSSVPWVASVFFQSVHITSKPTARMNYKVRCSVNTSWNTVITVAVEVA